MKIKYTQYQNTHKEYANLGRYISVVLLKNNLSIPFDLDKTVWIPFFKSSSINVLPSPQ